MPRRKNVPIPPPTLNPAQVEELSELVLAAYCRISPGAGLDDHEYAINDIERRNPEYWSVIPNPIGAAQRGGPLSVMLDDYVIEVTHEGGQWKAVSIDVSRCASFAIHDIAKVKTDLDELDALAREFKRILVDQHEPMPEDFGLPDPPSAWEVIEAESL